MKYKLQKTVTVSCNRVGEVANYLADVELVEVPEEKNPSDAELNLRMEVIQAQLTAKILAEELAKARNDLELAKNDKAYQNFTRLCLEKRDLQVELDRQRGILADTRDELAAVLAQIDNKS
jgi:BMFP domain-containing protein YqiC